MSLMRAWAFMSWFGGALLLAILALVGLAMRDALILAVPIVPAILIVGGRVAWRTSRSVDEATAIKRRWREEIDDSVGSAGGEEPRDIPEP